MQTVVDGRGFRDHVEDGYFRAMLLARDRAAAAATAAAAAATAAAAESAAASADAMAAASEAAAAAEEEQWEVGGERVEEDEVCWGVAPWD